MVDYLDFYLNSGQLKATNNQSSRQALIEALSASEDDQRVNLAVYGVSAMPEFQLQR